MWTFSPGLPSPVVRRSLAPELDHYSEAYGLNEDGIVVGAYVVSDEDNEPGGDPSPGDVVVHPDPPPAITERRVYVAFAWSDYDGFAILNERLEDQGVEVSVHQANAINKDGMIAARGVYDGKIRGLLLKPRR